MISIGVQVMSTFWNLYNTADILHQLPKYCTFWRATLGQAVLLIPYDRDLPYLLKKLCMFYCRSFVHMCCPPPQPRRSGASFTLNIDLSDSPRTRSSFNILESMRTSSPSTFRVGFGVLASRTKWLSQCGQYSSLSSNSSAFLRKHFLHFLQANVMSKLCCSGWSWVSLWQSAQSNHFRQHGERIETWALRMCLHMLLRRVKVSGRERVAKRPARARACIWV